MLSEIRSDWREDVKEAYSRARERLNEEYGGETVRAVRGKWGHDNGLGPKNGVGRSVEEEFEVAEVHTLEGTRRNQPNFLLGFELPGGSTYYDPEDVEVIS